MRFAMTSESGVVFPRSYHLLIRTVGQYKVLSVPFTAGSRVMFDIFACIFVFYNVLVGHIKFRYPLNNF